MSKNFELLQQIGNDEELFRTALPKDAAVTVDLQLSQVLDQETFESLMEKASAMGIFQTSDEAAQETPARPVAYPHNGGSENESAAEPVSRTPKMFRTPRNPTSRIGQAGRVDEPRITPRPVQTGTSPDSSEAEEKSRAISETVIKEPHRFTKPLARPISHRNGTSTSPWLASIKGAVKFWQRKAGERDSENGIDLEAITRQEESRLVQRVFPVGSSDGPRVALFAGLESAKGCGAMCARVAELLAARAEGPVCVVDANFEAPSLHRYFGLENLKGLAEATVESGPIQSFAQQIPEPDLWLISSGKAAPQLRFPAMADGLRVRMEELRETFKYVVIHSGPLRLETSAMLLSRWTDGVVLVLEANATRKDSARRVREMLDAANVNMLGVILNNRTFPIPDVIYRRLF
jgi:hypothetical protein